MLRGTDVAVNEFRRWPLLRIQEWVMEAIDVRNEEQALIDCPPLLQRTRVNRQCARALWRAFVWLTQDIV